jgi:hypothetical protein
MTIADRRARDAAIVILLLAVGSAAGAIVNFAGLRAAAEIRAVFPEAVDPDTALDVVARLNDWYLAHAYLVLVGELATAALFGGLYVLSGWSPRSAILGALVLAVPSTVLALAWSMGGAALVVRFGLLAVLARGLLRPPAAPDRPAG